MDCPNPAQIRRLIREENKAKDFPEDDPKESCQSDGELSAKILLGRLRANSVSVSDDEAAAKPRAKGEKDRMATAEKGQLAAPEETDGPGRSSARIHAYGLQQGDHYGHPGPRNAVAGRGDKRGQVELVPHLHEQHGGRNAAAAQDLG